MTLYRRLGIIWFWLAWPGLFLYLYRSSRTRLLLVCGDEVVVVESWLGDGKWSLPGGGLHRRETAVAGVIREAQEETGVSLDSQMLHQLLSEPYRDKGLCFHCEYFMAKLPSKVALRPQPREILRTQWINYHELSEDTASKDVLRALAAWLATR